MRPGAVVLGVVALGACRPDLGPGDSLVTSPRILAVKAEPPEAKPGALATYTALVASPEADAGAEPIRWRFCIAPKPLTENNSISTACLDDDASLVGAGSGPEISAATPRNACALFGPDTPPGGFRPRDPDATGGYYQPLLLDGVDGIALHLARILCNLADAPIDIASQFAGVYQANANPRLMALAVTIAGTAVPLDAIPAGARVDLEASWSAGDAESYAYFDRVAQTISTKRESLRVAWFASAGALDTESNGLGEDDDATSVTNVWSAPLAGAAHLWIVLRDSRGGLDFAAYDVTVVP